MVGTIRSAVVIGAGEMGAALAAHLANAGVRTRLLDIVPPEGAEIEGDPSSAEYRNALAARGLERALRSKPAAFFTRDIARLVTIGNLEDDLDAVADADWVLEAIVERLDIKSDLFARVAPLLPEHAVLSTNTSGLSIADMAAALPESLRPRFLGTHFFNPPRYLHLLELVPHDGTDPSVLDAMTRFGEVGLGKGVVIAHDTPNFIANRIGGFGLVSAIRTAVEMGMTVEEVDFLSGPLVGRPKSGTFRTADLVGIDVSAHATRTVFERATDDPWRETFEPPEIIEKLVAAGRLGEKAGEGFYKKLKRDGRSEILSLDLESFEYRERKKASFPSLEAARTVDDTGERMRALVHDKGRAGEFLWKTISDFLVYSAYCLGEIADDVVTIDRAIRWGWGWELGPFETWDALGVEAVAERLRAEGRDVPAAVDAVLKTPEKRFYVADDSGARAFAQGAHEPVPSLARHIDLDRVRRDGGVVKSNAGASLLDIGDGVLCLEFHSRMNAIGEDIIGMIHAAVREVEGGAFDALVIGNEGENFSVGANLMLLLLEAQDGNWEDIDLMVRGFQKATTALKYCRAPVVVAPFGMTLGGGCEVVLGANAVRAHAETYAGQVEVGVGLIPAGGGCKELLVRHATAMPKSAEVDPFSAARAAFDTIGLARVSTSAEHARDLRILRATDGVSMNRDHLLHDAKQVALGMAAAGYRAPVPGGRVAVAGSSGIAAIRAYLFNMKEGGHISEYDAYLGGELARVLCGGEVPSGTEVTEEYLLDLEREVFLRLCGQRRSQERMAHMLKKGKPLRN